MQTSQTLESLICRAMANERQTKILICLDSIGMSKPATYTEISKLFNPMLSTGLLGFNLSRLIKCGLISKNKHGLYFVTFRGKTCISIFRKIEEDLE